MHTSRFRRKLKTPEYDARANLAFMLLRSSCFFHNRNFSSSKTHMTGVPKKDYAAPALEMKQSLITTRVTTL